MKTATINKVNFLKYNVAWMIWAAVIMTLLMLPGSSLKGTHFWNRIPEFDKIVHCVMFACLAILMMYGFGKQSCSPTLKRGRILYCFAFCCAYAALTEFMQMKFATERSGELFDLLSDAAGVVAGIAMILFLKKRPGKKANAQL